MDKRRKAEIDAKLKKITGEFHHSAHHEDGNYGVLFMSTDVKNLDFNVSLECERENFKSMILTLMEMNSEVAEDVMIAVQHYKEGNLN